uniref:Uncharacterized protein n=1 Tax=Grammatophora oceanica TaxID=210454 RepID=A0A7S1UQ03_9STRA|mmetsp:Transcript_16637/g.24674  ORF Transcript_16637/g.24674 Transcript_16637/m.24674 type:complete len:102 (+) Transcript_16637:1294-1599(+)
MDDSLIGFFEPTNCQLQCHCFWSVSPGLSTLLDSTKSTNESPERCRSIYISRTNNTRNRTAEVMAFCDHVRDWGICLPVAAVRDLKLLSVLIQMAIRIIYR